MNPALRRLSSVALTLLVFAVGLAIGAWFSIGRRAAVISAGVEPRPAVAPSSASEIPRAFQSDEEMLTAIMSAAAEDEPLFRAHRLHDALENLSSAELAVLFERTIRITDRERRGALLGVLLQRWASINPVAASAAVRPYQDRFRTMGRQSAWGTPEEAVCHAWARVMPKPVLAEAMSSPDSYAAESVARIALQSLAQDDPARQLEILERFPSSRLRAQMCESAIHALAEKDSAAAEARLNLLPDRRRRASVLSEILEQDLVKLAERDPAAGFARIAAIAPELKSGWDSTHLVEAVLRAAAKHNPATALAAIDQLPEDLQKSALGSVLKAWAEKNLVDALTWAAGSGMVGKSGAVGWNSLLDAAFKSDPAKTFDWVRANATSSERDSMLSQGIWNATPEVGLQIYAELTPKNQAAVVRNLVDLLFKNGAGETESWVKAQPPGAARQTAIEALSQNQAANMPDRMDALIDAWPAGPDRDAAMKGVAWGIYGSDPRRALDLAGHLSDATTRESSIENLARAWLSGDDEPSARAWVVSAPDLSAEQKRVLLRTVDERRW
jgi:hypothetical protein